VRRFVEKLCPSLCPPLPRVFDDKFSIINSPDITLRHPFFDNDAKALARGIVEENRRPCPRSKPFNVIVTGKVRIFSRGHHSIATINGVC
jgi:hypothetical protein